MINKGAFLCAAILFSAVGAWWNHTGTVEGRVLAGGAPLENAAVYLVSDDDSTFDVPQKDPVMDQVNLRFTPMVHVVVPGSTVEFRNSDPVMHNVFSPGGQSEGFNLGTYSMDDSRSQTFNTPGVHVILCHVHPEMAGYVVVVPTQFHDITNDAGRFRIEGIPAGGYMLKVWHRSTDILEYPVTIRSGQTRQLNLRLTRR